MCAMAVIVGCAFALLLLVLCARWEARRKDERSRRAGLLVDGRPAGEIEPEPDETYHDLERGGRAFVTVKELIERERHATQRIPVVRRWRPSPYPTRGQR